MPSNRKGLTLLEVLVAATVIVLVLLSLLGAVSFALEGVRTAQGRQDATWYAQRLFEVIRDHQLASSVGFNDPAAARVALNAPPFDMELEQNPDYTRRLVSTRLSTDPTDYRSALYQVEVYVYWKTKGRENVYVLKGLSREG